MENTTTASDFIETFHERRSHICFKRRDGSSLPKCDTPGIPGTVTQRTCVFGGARVVLMPITDSIHLVHGPIGCASCTWDIRGSKTSGARLYKQGCSSDLQEHDIIFGGEKKLFEAIIELRGLHNPAAIFVYATCVSGVIGDDIVSVCKRAQEVTGCRVIPVHSEGFRNHNKSRGHWFGCDALFDYVIGTSNPPPDALTPFDINIIGEFNVAGDLWGIKPLLEYAGLNIISAITGDSKVEDIAKSHLAKLNIVQCEKSSNYLAEKMKEKYGIPSIKVNFFGIESTITSINKIVDFFDNEGMKAKANNLIKNGLESLDEKLSVYRNRLKGKTVALYFGGNKAWSLVRAFEELGMEVIMSGTNNGVKEDYENIRAVVKEGTLIVDNADSTEFRRLLNKLRPDLVISGAKEKYVALKLGIGFCDFNHDRISAFAGFDGFLEFAKVVDGAVSTSVWNAVGAKPLAVGDGRINERGCDIGKREDIDKKFSVVNPARMCQPMGAIQAVMGLKNAMPLIHGSQGCATYMRFQMIRHFREPIEVASTSLDEKNVIYGGEPNLLKALKNISEKKQPDVICAISTCLTETIGDDVEAIIRKFREGSASAKLPEIISVSTPSYAGSHIEGYGKAVLELVKNFGKRGVPSGKINLIMGNLSPRDVGEVKRITGDLAIPCVILTDTSLNLDAPLGDDALDLHKHGTTLEEIADTPNSKATISLSKHADAAARYLEETYNVKRVSDNLPVGIKNTDKFIKNICDIMGIPVPESITRDRGRLCDVLVDAHSYNYRKKAAIFGDPDIVIGLAHIVSEMGMIPHVLCVGIESERFREDVENLIRDTDKFPIVLEGCDLFDMEKVLEENKVDVLIGSAYGASIAGKFNIPLFRVGFPVFDRVGAQRIGVLGYNGGIDFVDRLTNMMIDCYYDSEGYKIGGAERVVI